MFKSSTGTRLFAIGLFLLAALRAHGAADPIYVRFNTLLGNMDVELLENDSPRTVANFLSYSGTGAFNNSIIQRSVPGFIFQGGGYTIAGNDITPIPEHPPIASEFSISNTRGTISMGLKSSGSNSAANEWFFNEVDNPVLDGTFDGGPYTAFGMVATPAGLAVMDAISNVPVPNPSPFAPPLDQIPLINYTSGNPVMLDNLVVVNSVTILIQSFSAWQTASFSPAQLGNPAYVGPTATPQGDGVPNLLKYFCHINPAGTMSAADRAALPAMGMTTIGKQKYLTLTYRQYAWITGITHDIQTSPDLRTWTTVARPIIVQTGLDSTTATGDPIMQAQIPVSGPSQFIRLNVTVP